MQTDCVRIVRFGGPEVLEAGRVEVGSPGAGEVLVRHTGVGVNFVDVYHRIGQLHDDETRNGNGRQIEPGTQPGFKQRLALLDGQGPRAGHARGRLGQRAWRD